MRIVVCPVCKGDGFYFAEKLPVDVKVTEFRPLHSPGADLTNVWEYVHKAVGFHIDCRRCKGVGELTDAQ